MFFNFRSSKPSIRISIQPIMLDPDPETFTRHFPGRWMSILHPLPSYHTSPYLPLGPLFPVSLLKFHALVGLGGWPTFCCEYVAAFDLCT